MRENHFKAWDKELKRWRTDIALIGGAVWAVQGTQLNSIEQDSVDLVFYIGLSDKNGKGIYEEDVLAWNGGIGDGHEYHVFWSKEDAGFYLIMTKRESSGYRSSIRTSREYCEECEIIGNCLENPELNQRKE